MEKDKMKLLALRESKSRRESSKSSKSSSCLDIVPYSELTDKCSPDSDSNNLNNQFNLPTLDYQMGQNDKLFDELDKMYMPFEKLTFLEPLSFNTSYDHSNHHQILKNHVDNNTFSNEEFIAFEGKLNNES